MSGLTILLVALGVPALIVLLALWYRSMMRKLTAIWAPNTQLVQGTFSRFRALLRGTYRVALSWPFWPMKAARTTLAQRLTVTSST